MSWARDVFPYCFCNADDILIFADKRVVLDYLSDDGEPATEAELLADDPEGNEFVARFLSLAKAASQKIIMACRRGQKYTLAKLAAIYSDETRLLEERADRQYQIIPLTVNLTIGMLIGRRVLVLEEVFKLAPFYKEALEILDELRNGLQIFDDFEQTHAEAGVHAINVSNSPLMPTWAQCGERLFGRDCCAGQGYPNVGRYDYPNVGG